jgi:DNA-binding transcriptional LysR family regulator
MMDILNINLNLLKSFWAVYRTGGITSGAKMLDLAPPSVSYNIKELERQIGCALFVAHNKGVRPTKEADVLFPHVDSAVASFLRGSEELKLQTNTEGGVVRIGLPTIAVNYILRDFLSDFSVKHPKIKLEFHHNAKSDYLTELESQNVDVAVMYFNHVPKDKNIKIVKVKEFRTTFYASRDFVARHGLGGTITVGQLKSLPFVMYTKSNNGVVNLEKSLGCSINSLNCTMVSSIVIALDRVMKGGGIGWAFGEFLDANDKGDIVKLSLVDDAGGVITTEPVVLEFAYNKKTAQGAARLFVEGLNKLMPCANLTNCNCDSNNDACTSTTSNPT